MRAIITALLIFSSLGNLWAQEWQTDAFGVYSGPDDTRENWSGLRAVCESGLSCNYTYRSAGEVAEIELFLGQKSSFAGQDQIMSLAVIHDAFGNSVQDDVVVTFSFQNGKLTLDTTSKLGRADVRVTAPIEAGVFGGSARANDTYSAIEFYRIVPNIATIAVDFPDENWRLEEGRFFKFESLPALDAYGNEVPLGIMGTLIMEDQEEVFVQVPTVSAGEAFFADIYVPRLTGTAYGKVQLGRYVQSKTELEVVPIALSPNVDLIGLGVFESGLIAIELGNIGTTSGRLIPDGTKFELSIERDGKKRSLGHVFTLDGKVHGFYALGTAPFPIVLTGESVYGSFQITVTGDEELPDYDAINDRKN